MNLLADEGVDQPIVELLRGQGHQVTAIAELAPSLPDDDVLRAANDGRALLLTQDRDFGELVFRLRRAAHGVLLIRLHGLAPAEKAAREGAALRAHGKSLVGQFSVLSRRSLRIHALPATDEMKSSRRSTLAAIGVWPRRKLAAPGRAPGP